MESIIILKMLHDRLIKEEWSKELDCKVERLRREFSGARGRLADAQRRFDDPELETDGTHLKTCQNVLKSLERELSEAHGELKGYEAGMKRAQRVVTEIIRYGRPGE